MVLDLTPDQVDALLYACEDIGEVYAEDEDPTINRHGQTLLALIPTLQGEK